jgi:hypothetical protein
MRKTWHFGGDYTTLNHLSLPLTNEVSSCRTCRLSWGTGSIMSSVWWGLLLIWC